MSNKVFVATYGSLRKGMQNYGVNENAGATYVGRGLTLKNFDLFRYQGAYFPSVSLEHNSAGKPVVVDVFETDLDGLTGPYDRLEGYSDNENYRFYNRSEIEVGMEDGSVVTAWIYHIDEEQDELVESGDWCKYNGLEGYE